MAQTPIYRFNGQAFALQCNGTTVVGPVTVTNQSPTCAFWNFSNTGVAVTITAVNALSAPPGFTFPVNGSPSVAPAFILPPLMDIPTTVVVPQGGYNVFCVAQTSGTPSIQFVPAEMQS